MLVKDFILISKSSNETTFNIEFRQNWLVTNGLKINPTLADSQVQPIVKFHFSSLEKYYPYEHCDLSAVFQIIIFELEKLILSESSFLEIDLKFLGKIIKANGFISFSHPSNPDTQLYKAFNIQTLLKFNSTKNAINQNFKLPQIRGKEVIIERPLEVLVSQDNTNYEKKNPKNLNTLKSKIGNLKPVEKNHQENVTQKSNVELKKPKPSNVAFLAAQQENKLLAEKYNSETFDNFAFDKNKFFSQMYKTPEQIWNEEYIQPDPNKHENLKILEKHSQTKARPIALMFNSLSVSSRIAINSTPLSKYLYLDPDSKKITILHNNENTMFSTKKTKSDELKMEKRLSKYDSFEKSDKDSNSEDENSENHEMQRKLHERFYRLVRELIKEDEVIDFSNKLMENLKSQAEKCLANLKMPIDSQFLNEIFAEIKYDFKNSLKKGILLYLLKDPEERNRLELWSIPERVEEYGHAKKPKIVFKNKRGMVADLSVFLNENLMLFSAETNQILDCWSLFNDENLFNFNIPENGIDISDFIEQQRSNIIRIRNIITSTWIKKISEIYKTKSKNLKKKQLKIFFDTMGIVISGQVRQLIETSLQKLLSFFSFFESKNPLSMEQIYKNFLSKNSPLEKYFLVINLKEKDNKLVFENDIESVIDELIEIIKDAVKCSENVARPENFFHRLDKNNLDAVSLTEPFVEETIAKVKIIIMDNFQRIENFDFIFQEFYYLFEEKNNLLSIIADGIGQEGLLELFQKYEKLEGENVKNFPFEIPFKMIKINASNIKQQLIEIPTELRKIIEDHVYKEIDTLSVHIVKTLKSNFDGLTTRIDNVEKLIEKETWLNNFKRNDFPGLQANYIDIVRWYDRFSPFIKFSFDKLKHIYEAKEQILEYRSKIEKEEYRIKNERDTLEKRLIGRKGVVNSKATELASKVESYRKEGKAFWIEKMLSDIGESKTNLLAISKDIELINKEEELMGFPKSEFENVRKSASSILLFESFWQNISDWTTEHDKWEKTVIFKLDIDKAVEKFNSIYKILIKLIGDFKSLKIAGPEPIALGDKTISAIEVFKKDFEMVRYFCNEGLSQRHWHEINKCLQSNGIDVKLESGGTYYISTLRDLNLTAIQNEIAEISSTATKEWENEKFLLSVENEYENKCLELIEYKHSTEMYIMTSKFSEDTILTIDSHLHRIKLMVTSPYAVVFKIKIEELQKLLNNNKSILELWIKLQSLWIYLEPIFNTDDVVKSLPQESMKFKEVQIGFRGLVLARKRDPSFKELSFDLELTDKLTSMIQTLEKVDKNLENYLDKKRNDFPRLYFLSSESLIEMIANVKQFSKINKQIKIIFNGISELKINSNEEIEGIVSFEGEVLLFTQKLSVKNFKGHIERWLSSLEETLFYEVKKNLITSLQDFAKVQKENFMYGRIGQIVQNVLMTAWTFETENSISMSGFKGLRENQADIEKYIEFIAGQIVSVPSQSDVLTMEGIINRSVHNRTVLEYLCNQKIQKISDYAWESQLRYYWEQNNVIENSTSKLQMMYSSTYYSYEYVGNSTRFILTPMTDRCFRSFFTASQMFFSNCLEGPSATGKTETVKEFAKCAAKFLYVVNSSSLIDSQSAIRVLKGLAISGNWACFDEFNLIELDVLSVMSQQIFRIQSAMSQGKHEFVFNGSLIKFRSTCSIFVTVNSGYADTIDLPENVKYLFRSMAVVLPDVNIIIESRLFSSGFVKAQNLAQKIINYFDFCRNLFAEHSHYNFSLRAILSVIEEAKISLKKEEMKNEENLILKAILKIIANNFSASDLRQFKEIGQFYFPQEEMTNVFASIEKTENWQAIRDFISTMNENYSNQCQKNVVSEKKPSVTEVDSLKEINPELSKPIQSNDQLSQKIQESKTTLTNIHSKYIDICPLMISRIACLRAMTSVRHGILLLGDTMSGKTNVLDLYSKFYEGIKLMKINPGSMDTSDLFGRLDKNTLEWSTGVLQSVFNQLFDGQSKEIESILVFDGPLHRTWIENINTLTDDSKRLTLPSGDTYFLPNKSTVILETDSVKDLSPASISRCGIIYFDNESQIWKRLKKSWLESMFFFTPIEKEKIEIFFSSIYEPILKTLKTMDFKVKLNDAQIFKSFIVFATEYMNVFEDPILADSIDCKDKLVLIDQAFIFSLIWSVGILVEENQLKTLDLVIKKLSKTPEKSLPSDILKQFRKITLPENGQISEHNFIFVKNEKDKTKIIATWQKWSENGHPHFESVSFKQRLDQIIPLSEHTKYLKIISFFNKRKENILICGRVGTGKSTLLSLISKQIDSELSLIVPVSFVTETTPREINSILNKFLIKKINEDILYPVNGKQNLVFLIEDINLGKSLTQGNKNSVEYMRYLCNESSFFDLDDKDKTLKQIKLPQIIASATINDSTQIMSARMLSNFYVLPLCDLEDESLSRIFSVILNHHFDDSFSTSVLQKLSKVVTSIGEIIRESKKKFDCSSSKSKYLFSIKDMFRIIEGVTCVQSQTLKSAEDLLKLFVFECWNTVALKLDSEEDELSFLNGVLRPMFVRNFSSNFESIIGFNEFDDGQKLKLLNFIKKNTYSSISTVDYNPKGFYIEVSQKEKVYLVFNSLLQQYNLENEKQINMNITDKMIEVLLRMHKIFDRFDYHYLLLENNEQIILDSLTLCAKIRSGVIFQLQVDENQNNLSWKETICNSVTNAAKGKQTVLYIHETQLKFVNVIDIIGLLVNNGDFFTFINEVIIEELKLEVNSETGELNKPVDILNNVKKNFHIVMYFSPNSAKFKEIFSESPSLVNAFQVIFSQNWTDDVYQGLASHSFAILPTLTIEQKVNYEIAVVNIHKSMNGFYEEFQQKKKIVIQNVTTNFQKFLDYVKKMFDMHHQTKFARMAKFEYGYNMLLESEEIVFRQHEKMEELKPILTNTDIRIAGLVKSIEDQKKIANQKEQVISLEGSKIRLETENARLISEECQYEINLIQPELDRAQEEIMRLTKQEIDEIKQIKTPSLSVQYAMQALCLLMNVKPELKRDGVTGRNNPDWWATAKLYINSLTPDVLINFNNSRDIEENAFKKLEAFFTDPKAKEYLDENSIRFSSPTVCSLFLWVTGQMNLYSLNQSLIPKKKALEIANLNLKNLQETLDVKIKEFDEIQAILTKLKSEHAIYKSEKEKTENDIEVLTRKIEFAQRILVILPDEKIHWKEQFIKLKEDFRDIDGEIIVSAGFLTYLGILDILSRNKVLQNWQIILQDCLLVTERFSAEKALSKLYGEMKIQEWVFLGLQNDTFSIDNAVLIECSSGVLFFSDPHLQARRWIDLFYQKKTLIYLQTRDSNFMAIVQNAITSGFVLCVDEASLPVDPQLNELVNPCLSIINGEKFIQFGNSPIIYNDAFKIIFLSRVLEFDNVASDLSAFSFINFEITKEGLAAQIISQLINSEKPTLEKMYKDCVADNFLNTNQLFSIEMRLLDAISGDKSQILDDKSIMDILVDSKQISTVFNEKQVHLLETYAEVIATRKDFEDLANRIASLFLMAINFEKVNRLYQITLEDFIEYLSVTLTVKQTARTLGNRLFFIENTFMRLLCKNVCKGFFGNDKLLFVFTIGLTLESAANKLEQNEGLFNFLLLPVDSANIYISQNNDYPWISKAQWKDLHYLGTCFSKFKDICFDTTILNQLTNLMRPDNFDRLKTPDGIKVELTPSEKLCLLKTMHPEMTTVFIENYIQERFGPDFLKGLFTDDFEQSINSSSIDKPIVLLVKHGQDPFAYVNSKNPFKTTIIENITMGKDQVDAIGRVLEECVKTGSWIVLQNFNIETLVWPILTQKIIYIKQSFPDFSKNFKMFVSCHTYNHIPFQILRNSIHIAIEEPRDLKSAFKTIFEDDLLNNQEFHDSCDKKKLLQQIAMPLCVIHSVLQERARIGVGGFSTNYKFISSDFKITLQQLQILLSKLGDDFSIPIIKNFMIECNYGSRMTNQSDKQLLQAILDTYLNSENLKTGKISLNPDFDGQQKFLNDLNSRTKAFEFTQSLPENCNMEIIGIDHQKCQEMNFGFKKYFQTNLPKIFADSKMTSMAFYEYMKTKMMRLIQNIPTPLDNALFVKKFPNGKNFVNVVMLYENDKLSQLIANMRKDLNMCLKSISNYVKWNSETAGLIDNLNKNILPNQWKFWSFSSFFTIQEFLHAICESNSYFKQLLSEGKQLSEFKLSAFSNQTGLIQAFKMNFASENHVSSEKVFQKITIASNFDSGSQTFDGIKLTDIHLLYGSYDFDQNQLVYDDSSQICQQVQLRVEFSLSSFLDEEGKFSCPMYAKRSISQDENCHIKCHEQLFHVVMDCERTPDFWVKRGTKLLAFKVEI